jgi:Ca2+-binding EF-hand superfamily protein
MFRIFSVAAASLLFATSVASLSQAYEESRFLGIDRNADNMISMEEATAYRERLVKEYDLNGDGKVEYEEYVQAENLRPSTDPDNSEIPVPDEYKEMDSDGDTIVTLEEAKAAGALRFKALDKNADGMVSKEEFVSPGL